MREKKIPSVWSIYMGGLGCLLGALLFPVYRLWGFVATVAMGAAVYLLFRWILPHKIQLVPQREKPFSTGEKELDQALEEAREDLAQLSRLNVAIRDAALSFQIQRMEKAGAAILKEVADNPEKGKKIRRFVTYYLPYAIKILSSYAKISTGGFKGENARGLMEEVEQNAVVIADAFEGQLDRLFSGEVLDVSSDIDVLKGMMKGDGLTPQ